MEEKKHVGRPTNEEVASRKRKKVVKVSLITLVCVLLFGGLFAFLNRDKIDFSSLMGNSSIKTYNYRVNQLDNQFNNNYFEGYYIKFTNSAIVNVNSCSSNNTNYAICKPFNNGEGILVGAKKSGIVTLKVTVYNKKNQKLSKKIKVKIGKDFKSPVCSIHPNATSVKKGESISVTLKCSEKVIFLNDVKNNKLDKNGYSAFGLLNNYKRYNLSVTNIKSLSNNSYKIYLKLPNNVVSGSDYIIEARYNILKDSSNNVRTYGFSSKYEPRIKVY